MGEMAAGSGAGECGAPWRSLTLGWGQVSNSGDSLALGGELPCYLGFIPERGPCVLHRGCCHFPQAPAW